MPQRYEGRKLPAMLYAYPFDHVQAVVLVSAGVLINMFPGSTPAAIMDLPAWAAVLFRLMCLLGGALIAVGLVKGKHRWSFTSEASGMVLAAGVWITYSIGLFGNLQTQPGAVLVAIWSLATGAACLIRARAINIESGLRLQLLIEAGQIKRSKPE